MSCLKANRCGQSSMEYIMVAGLMTLVIIPTTFLFYSYASGSSDEIELAQIEKFGRDVAMTAETVYYLGHPSKLVIEERLPNNVVSMSTHEDADGVYLLTIGAKIKGDIVNFTFPTSVKILGNFNENAISPGQKVVRIYAGPNFDNNPFVSVNLENSSCVDGKINHNTCSETPPLFCFNGVLIPNCICGGDISVMINIVPDPSGPNLLNIAFTALSELVEEPTVTVKNVEFGTELGPATFSSEDNLDYIYTFTVLSSHLNSLTEVIVSGETLEGPCNFKSSSVTFNIDTQDPTVSVLHSPQNPTIDDIVTLAAIGNDIDRDSYQSGIKEINIFVDDDNKKTCLSSPCEDSSKYQAATYNYYAVIEDNAGNSKRDPLTGTKTFTVLSACIPSPEICDGLDNDCDTLVDNGCDDDFDLYCDASLAFVPTPAICPLGGLDCDDTAKLINPGSGVACNYDDSCNVITDDPACGTVSCSGWYLQTGTQSPKETETCFNKADITSDRCEGYADCKDPNTAHCNAQPANLVKYSCGKCKFIDSDSCTGTVLGSCSNYKATTSCGDGSACDGKGNCIKLKANGKECNAANECQSGFCYTDSDEDRYAPESGTKICQASSQLPGIDCYDSNNDVHPGQTEWFDSPWWDSVNFKNSYDWDCDGIVSYSDGFIPVNNHVGFYRGGHARFVDKSHCEAATPQYTDNVDDADCGGFLCGPRVTTADCGSVNIWSTGDVAVSGLWIRRCEGASCVCDPVGPARILTTWSPRPVKLFCR